MEKKIKVLAISGSPRKGATEWSLKRALSVIEEYPHIETNFWSVRGKKLSPCIHCDRCVRENTLCYIEDDVKEIEKLILESDVILIGSPVYDMNITAQLSMVINRMRPHYLVYPGAMRNKLGAALSVGGTRHGGQEITNQAIHNFFLMNEMLVTGGLGGCYNGGTIWSKDDRKNGAENDSCGTDTVERLASAVAQAALCIEFGRNQAQIMIDEAKVGQEELSPLRDH